MASSSSSFPSLPVLSSQSWNYDVFLSFRGVDTRKTFVDHLYKALDQQGIYTYKDDVTLERGESINPALLKAIEESQIAVIVFSKNYANSKWCLDELTHIMKRTEEGKQTVIPIFYDVEPTEVRYQKRTYEDAFAKHELANTEKVESWRKALFDASNLSGWETKLIANGHEAQGIKKIVDEISQRLVTSRENEDLVGMRTRVQGLKSKLQIEAGGVCMIGLWGVGGGGKTTLASSIYDDISSMFDSCCFVKNIREESSSKNGLEKLQRKLLSGILKMDVQEVSTVEDGRSKIKARLGHKSVLIVLDDVDKIDQLQELVGSHGWFGQGSRIIITTRDEHLLIAHGVDVIQSISLFNNDEAIKLFCKYAHWDLKPPKDFEKLLKEVVSYASGLPLALKVLGSYLCGRNSMQWKSALNKLKDIPHKDIIGILRISFDGLEQDEKDMFLDIACFYRWGRKDQAMEVFDACGFHPGIVLEVLRQKALIVIDDNGRFDMHDVVQEMAHYIVREKYPKNPEKHSRVWKEEEVRRILDMAATKELDNIEAINVRGISYEDRQRFLQVAGNMTKLRWIYLNFNYWSDYAKRDENIVPLPSNFPPTQLCYLYLHNCIRQKQLWEGYKVSVGNGEKTSFWEEKWHEDGNLKNIFPRMYALEVEKKVKVKDRISKKMEDWDRRREIRDGRERTEANILEELTKTLVLSDKRDKWEIPGAPNGEFSTAWIRECIESFKAMGQIQQNFWNKWVPKKHNIFIWRLIRNRLPTRKNLVDMGMDIPSTLCPLCERKEEDVFHLFFDCNLSTLLWSKLGVWWSLPIPSFKTGEDPLIWSWFSLKNRWEGIYLQVAIMAILVTIWRARNGTIFDKKKAETEKEFRVAQELAYFWLVSRNSKFKMELGSWISNPKTLM